MSTNEFARQLGITPGAIYKALSARGSYYGVSPLKLPNGRLLWPAEALAKLKGGAA